MRLSPIVAGVVRGWDWNYVFYASAGWIVIMGIVCLLIYREPPRDTATESQRSLGEVFRGMIEVVGNGRFFMLISGLLVILVMGSKWWSFSLVGQVAAAWLIGNLLLDVLFRATGGDGAQRPWFLEPMKIGEGRYLLFLLLMAQGTLTVLRATRSKPWIDSSTPPGLDSIYQRRNTGQ